MTSNGFLCFLLLCECILSIILGVQTFDLYLSLNRGYIQTIKFKLKLWVTNGKMTKAVWVVLEMKKVMHIRREIKREKGRKWRTFGLIQLNWALLVQRERSERNSKNWCLSKKSFFYFPGLEMVVTFTWKVLFYNIRGESWSRGRAIVLWS